MNTNIFPFPLDASGEAKPRPTVCWWIPLLDPIGLADGTELHFVANKCIANLFHDESESLAASSSIEFDITLLIQQVDAPWEQSPGERAAFEVARMGREFTDKSTSTEVAGSRDSAPTRRISVIRAAASISSGSDFDSDSISIAFDSVILHLRRVQASYSLVSQWPMNFVARESLPMILPFEMLSPTAGNDQERDLGLFHINTNGIEQAAPPTTLTDRQEEMLHIALDRDHAAFSSYHRLRHDASVSLRRRGDYRSSLLHAASAAEVFLDDLLLHIMWEEEIRPEDAGQIFADPRSGTIKRLKSEYVPRIHGIWNPTQNGPTHAWRNNIARVRNRTIHAGYEPTISEAELAYETLIDLERHGADLVAARSSKYPRTALAICGEDGLRRRGKFTQRIQQLMNDKSEPIWTDTFVRWKNETMRARNRNDGLVEEPTLSRASLLIVGRKEGTSWVLHDALAGMAARVDPDLEALPSTQAAAIESIVGGLGDGVAHIQGPHNLLPNEPWVGQHRRVPGYGVMVNREDFY